MENTLKIKRADISGFEGEKMAKLLQRQKKNFGSRYKRLQTIRDLISSEENKKTYKIVLYNSRGIVSSVNDIPEAGKFQADKILFDLTQNKPSITSFIVAHNKKEGSVVPKEEDDKLINLFKSAGKKIGVPMMDYFILSNDAVFSRYRIDI